MQKSKFSQLFSVPGIYSIENTINGKKYIGSTKNIRKRFNEHVSGLRHNRHKNKHLQNAFNLYGESNFVFSILVDCDEPDKLMFEQFFLDKLCPEYNVSTKSSSSLGVKRSFGQRILMSLVRSDVDFRLVSLLSPEGVVVKMNTYLCDFCRKEGLNSGHLSDVIRGNRKSHKGWRLCPQ